MRRHRQRSESRDRRRYHGLLVAGTVASAIALAACSSSPGSSSAASTTSSSKGNSGSGPIVIGGVIGTTGAYGVTGVQMKNSTQLAISKINANGGVLGRKLTFKWYNDQASATVATQLFHRVVSEGAVAVEGSGDAAPATTAVANKMGIPEFAVIDDGGLTIQPTGPSSKPLPWSFDTATNSFAYGTADAKYANSNCSNLAVLHDPTPYGVGGNDAIKAAYKGKIVLDSAISEDWSSGATVPITAEINKLKQANASCVVVWLTPQDEASFVKTAASLGDKFTVIGNDETNASTVFPKLAGSAAVGVVTNQVTALLHPSAKLKAFQKEYATKFGGTASVFGYGTYDGVMMVAKAIEMEHSTSPKAIQKGLNSITDFTGLTGKLSLKGTHQTMGANELTAVKWNGSAWVPAS